MPIYFSSRSEKYHEFSNFGEFLFELDGELWPSVEHYYQAMKCDDPIRRAEIRNCKSPMKAKQMGGKKAKTVRADWEHVKTIYMYRAVAKKFTSHPELAQMLCATDDEELIEDVPDDYFWGCGSNRTGLNMLGRILMIVRSEIKEQGV